MAREQAFMLALNYLTRTTCAVFLRPAFSESECKITTFFLYMQAKNGVHYPKGRKTPFSLTHFSLIRAKIPFFSSESGIPQLRMIHL